MNRDEFAKRIRWSWIIWLAGLVNVGAMLPQLWKIISTHNVSGLSPTMFWIYFWIQVAFSLEGYFKRNRMFVWCLGLSAVVSISIIISIYLYR